MPCYSFVLYEKKEKKSAERGVPLIEVTKLNGVKVLDQSTACLKWWKKRRIRSSALTTGRKIIVKESRQEIKNLVKSYRKDIFRSAVKRAEIWQVI